MRCTTCGGDLKVLETREPEEFYRRRRYACITNDKHRFSTIEIPEIVFNDQRTRLMTRLDMARRGASQRRREHHVHNEIAKLLNQQLSLDAIALIVGCSKSLVQKRLYADVHD